MNNYLKGIDVSFWQGTIDWETVKGNIDFAVVRAGYGKNVDSQAKRNIAECERLNIPYAIYWFSYATCNQDAENEAKKAVEFLNGKECVSVFYDWEYDSEANFVKATRIKFQRYHAASYADVFCHEVEKSGYRAGVYTNHDYYNTFKNVIRGNRLLWMAHYKATEPPEKWDVWQCSSTEKVNGIVGNVDFDYMKKGVLELEEKRYHKIDDVPSAYREHVQRYVDDGIIAGKGGDLDLTEDMVRTLIFCERMMTNG